jgi:hypothetical protein
VQLRITFFFPKKNGPRKAEMFHMFDCFHFNQARTRTLSVLLGPDPARGPGPFRTLKLWGQRHVQFKVFEKHFHIVSQRLSYWPLQLNTCFQDFRNPGISGYLWL